MTQANERLARIEALVESNARTMAEMQRWQQTEAREWRAGIDDAIALASQGITEIGEKIDRLIEAITGVSNQN